MKRLALLTLAFALTASAAFAGDNDWRLRIKKEADGWTASFEPNDRSPFSKSTWGGHKRKGGARGTA